MNDSSWPFEEYGFIILDFSTDPPSVVKHFTSSLIEADKFGNIIKDNTMASRRDKYFNEQREELSDDGKKLWDAMMDGINNLAPVADKNKSTTTKVRIVERVVETDETQRLRLELRKLQQNSKLVVADCEAKIKEYTKKEKYFMANEAKVAAFCHKNFIERIQRILDGESAFAPNQEYPGLTGSAFTVEFRNDHNNGLFID